MGGAAEKQTEGLRQGLPGSNALGDGDHTFRVRAIDVPGNATPAERAWTVDTANPAGQIVINGGRALTAKRTVTLSLSAADPAPFSGVAHLRLMNAGGVGGVDAPSDDKVLAPHRRRGYEDSLRAVPR